MRVDMDTVCPDLARLRVHVSTTSATATVVVAVNGVAGDPFEASTGTVSYPVRAHPTARFLRSIRFFPVGCGRFRPGYTFRTPTGCGPGSLTVTFTDLCFGEVGLGIVNSATGQQTFDVLRNGAVQTQFTVDGGNSVRRLTATSAAHTYVVPTACAKPDQIDVSFTDTCTATSVTIANYGWLHPFLIQTSDGLADLHVIPIGKTKTIEVSGATITVSKTRSENPLLATHHHAEPAGCDALPVTGSSTLRLAAVGVLIVLLGQ